LSTNYELIGRVEADPKPGNYVEMGVKPPYAFSLVVVQGIPRLMYYSRFRLITEKSS